MNENQTLAYNLVSSHFASDTDEQLLLVITGLARSGKSYVIDAIRHLPQDKCNVLAYFGVAAFNVKGETLHSLLQLSIGGRKCGALKGQALNRLQEKFNGISYIIIDEYSVVGQCLFGWIDKRCRQATGMATISFGSLSLILVGDVAQLQPITDKVLYYDKPKGDFAT